MCMEDKRLGRESGAFTKAFSITATQIQIVPFSADRTVIIVSNRGLSGASLFLAHEHPASNPAFHIPSGTLPFIMRIEDFGSIITEPWWAWATASNFVYVTQVILNKR